MKISSIVLLNNKSIKKFQKTIWDFYKNNKRDFPWRTTKNPYHILISEVMLQQTQAERVVVYYQKFIKYFPNFTSLAKAKFSQIYPLWQGLGYNRRALALQKTAQKAVQEYKGKLPQDISLLEEFPGIGPYTARAISIFSFNTPVACIETNIRRVFIHHFFPLRHSSGQAKKIDDREILAVAEQTLDKKNSREWHWALMDYGAYLKSTVPNPNRRHKNYSIQSTFEGSLRQIRGTALKMLSVRPMDINELTERLKKATSQTKERIKKVILALEKEGLITCDKKFYSLK